MSTLYQTIKLLLPGLLAWPVIVFAFLTARLFLQTILGLIMPSRLRRFLSGLKQEQPTEKPSSRERSSTDKQTEHHEAGSQSDDAASSSAFRVQSELPRYPKPLKELLRGRLRLGERPVHSTDDEPSSLQQTARSRPLRDMYTAMRIGKRQELENRFEALFGRFDQIEIDVTTLMDTLKRERRICESGLGPRDSLYLVEELETALASTGRGIPKAEVDDKARGSLTKRGGEIRRLLVKLLDFAQGGGVRHLAANLDTIHRLAPSLCESLHGALDSSAGAADDHEEWEEFFLEPDRLRATHSASISRDADSVRIYAIEYEEVFSLERALQVDRSNTPSGTIKAMLDWPSAELYSFRRDNYQQQFFTALRKLPATEQESALACLREAVFDELVPENPEEPWSFGEFIGRIEFRSGSDRWFNRILSFSEQSFRALFGAQNADDVRDLARQVRDEYYKVTESDEERLKNLSMNA